MSGHAKNILDIIDELMARYPGAVYLDQYDSLAIEDLAESMAVYRAAIERGVGHNIKLVDTEWEVLF